jgi:segregation and condensation protein A
MEAPIPQVKLPCFEGPLDLLLFLIRQQEIDIQDIPINQITHQYLSALDTMRNLNLEVAGEFILMVAYLLYIKAQMLLPHYETVEGEDPRTPLVQKLLEYQKFKQLGEELKRMELERGGFFPRAFDPSFIGSSEELKSDISAYDLYCAYRQLVALRLEKEPMVITLPNFDIEEKIQSILNSLAPGVQITFSQLAKSAEKQHLISTFIALLEMVKRGILKIKQPHPFANFKVLMESNVRA